ncbi:MAG: rhodanese-like domain-containing protein [Bryobacteraceae bacterium]
MSLPYEITVQEVKALVDGGGRIELIDVREMHEHALTRIDGADLIPMNTVPQRVSELEARAEEATLVIFCHHGMRSLNVVSWLRRQGIEQCQSMAGGIDAWSIAIDPGVPRY